jgi:hypothetical protein
MRQLILLLLLCLPVLAACDETTSGSTVEYRHKSLHSMLTASPATIPVVFHASPDANINTYMLQSLAEQADVSGLAGLRFALSEQRQLGDLTVEVAYQPHRERTGISLCQQKPVGGGERSQKTFVLAIALCRDGRRLSSVRGAESLPGDPEGNAEAVTALIDRLTDALLGG